MPRSEDIMNSIWAELDDLPNDALMLYVWSWTNERCGMAGIYRCPKRQLLEGRLDSAPLDAALDVLSREELLFYTEGVLWCVARLRRLRTKTPQIARSVANDLAEVPEGNPLRDSFLQMYGGVPWLRGALSDLQTGEGPERVPRGSREGQENPKAKPNVRGSGDPPERVLGLGLGLGHGNGQGTTARVGLVDSAPEPIRNALPGVLEILGRISEVRGVPFEDAHRVCAAMLTYPDADHVAAASDMEDWLCNGRRGKTYEITDLIQTFRKQLERKQAVPIAPSRRGKQAAKDRSSYDAVVEPAA